MRYSQLIAPQTSEVVTVPDPDPGAGQVLVRVTACGVCASELRPWLDGPGDAPVASAVGGSARLGHEPVGVVEAVGPGVAAAAHGIALGERVTGLFNRSFGELALANASSLLRVPDALADERAMGEPIACLVNAVRRTPIGLGQSIAIVGLGYMGLGYLHLAKLRDPGRVVAIDVREEAREHARAVGVDAALHPDELPDSMLLDNFGDWDSDRGFDVVVEASGTQAGLTLAGRLVRAHGVLAILGYHQGGVRQVDMTLWNWKAIDVVNAHVRRHADLMESMRIGLDLEASGRIDLGGMITHRVGLDGVDAAFTALRDKPTGFIKAVVLPQDGGAAFR